MSENKNTKKENTKQEKKKKKNRLDKFGWRGNDIVIEKPKK